MIDTVCFSAQLTQKQFHLLRKQSIEHIGRNNVSKTTEYRIVKGEINTGSHDSHIIIRCHEDDYKAQFQVSLPKQHYGHNIYLLPCSLVEQVLFGLQDKLREFVGDFPPYKEWVIERLDLCYAWRFQDQATALGVLRVLTCFDFPRKKKFVYPDESIHWAGRSYAVKFYLKALEFLKHDHRQIFKTDKDLANVWSNLSMGVLRFELSFRKRMLPELFYGKERLTYKDVLDEEHIFEILNKYKNKLLCNLDPRLTSDRDVIEILKQAYKHKKALRLYTFINNFSSLAHEKQFLKENYHQTTIWRNKRDLSIAGVGIRTDIPSLDFSLDIPSTLTADLLPLATARGSA